MVPIAGRVNRAARPQPDECGTRSVKSIRPRIHSGDASISELIEASARQCRSIATASNVLDLRSGMREPYLEHGAPDKRMHCCFRDAHRMMSRCPPYVGAGVILAPALSDRAGRPSCSRHSHSPAESVSGRVVVVRTSSAMMMSENSGLYFLFGDS